MFVIDLIRDALTSTTQRNNAIMPEMEKITTEIDESWTIFPLLISNRLSTKIAWNNYYTNIHNYTMS